LDGINQTYNVIHDAEITIEANPDDIDRSKIDFYKLTGINRLSIGVQSFSDKDLQFLKRRHNNEQAVFSIEVAYNRGIKNISADLIFGIPGMSAETLKESINIMTALPVSHISAYQLGYENGTLLFDYLSQGRIKEVHDSECEKQFYMISDLLQRSGFEHYEISNYALKDFRSVHNSNYWNGTKYLGLGPSSHSYNGISRQWNESDLNEYLEKVKNGEVPYSIELLTKNDFHNEYIMTRLRSVDGFLIEEFIKKFGGDAFNHAFDKMRKYIDRELISFKDNRLTLTFKGMFVSDMIFRDLIIV
jgi:oxygen-independent coproporphyrinogen-3 oxidase